MPYRMLIQCRLENESVEYGVKLSVACLEEHMSFAGREHMLKESWQD